MIADHYTGTQRSRMLVLVDSFWAFGWIAASLLAFSDATHWLADDGLNHRLNGVVCVAVTPTLTCRTGG